MSVNGKIMDSISEAKAAGLSDESAIRWAFYLKMKESKGEKPIALSEAVRQKQEAIANARN